MSSTPEYQQSISSVVVQASTELIEDFWLPATENKNFWPIIGKRVAAEFIFLALIPLSCAEAVARLALTVFPLLAECVGVSDEGKAWLWEVTWQGAALSGLACIFSLLAVFDNLYHDGRTSHFSFINFVFQNVE